MPPRVQTIMVFGPRTVPFELSWNPGIITTFNPAAVASCRAVTGRPSTSVNLPPMPAELLWSVWLCVMVTTSALNGGSV